MTILSDWMLPNGPAPEAMDDAHAIARDLARTVTGIAENAAALAARPVPAPDSSMG